MANKRARKLRRRGTGQRQSARLQDGARGGLPAAKMARRGRARAPGLSCPGLPLAGSATRVAVRRFLLGLGGGPGRPLPRTMWLLGWWQVLLLLWVLGPPARGLEGECGQGPWLGAGAGGARNNRVTCKSTG